MAELGAGEEEEAKGPSPREIASFLVAAARRRRKLAVTMFFLCVFAGVGVMLVKPPVYIAAVTIAARNNNAVQKTATQNQVNYENLTKGAATVVLNDDNLVALLADAQISSRWDAERTPVFRLKDKLVASLVGKPSQEDFERGLVGMLGQRLTVTTTGDDTINIQASWPTREGAYRLVTAAQARFLATQHASDVAMIGEGVTIIQSYVQQQGADVATALEELKALKEGRQNVATEADAGIVDGGSVGDGSVSGAASRPRYVSRPVPSAPTLDPAIKKNLDEKRQELAGLEDDRRKRLSEAQAQLADLRGTLGPAHPQVVGVQSKVESLSQPSPRASELQAEVASLENQVTESNDLSVQHAKQYLASNVEGPSVPSRRVDGGVSNGSIVIMAGEPQDDPATIAAKDKLSGLTTKYDELKGRLRSAKIDLDVAEAAFKYKYIVMVPAEMPKKPKPPPPFVFALAGVVLGALMFFLIPALADLASGRVMASWQVRKLGIDVLGEIDSHS